MFRRLISKVHIHNYSLSSQLESLQSLQSNIQSTKSRIHKLELLKSRHDLHPLLKLIYDQSIKFGVTSKSIQINKTTELIEFNSVENALEELIEQKHKLQFIRNLAASIPSYHTLLSQILDRNLQLGLGPSTILESLNVKSMDLPVSLGVTFDEEEIKERLLKGERFLASRKFDGVRCIAKVIDGTNVELLSRMGKPIPNVPHLIPQIQKLAQERSIIFDGELVSMVGNTIEDFARIMSIVKSNAPKKELTERVLFKVFDILLPEEFDEKVTRSEVLSERLKRWTEDTSHVSLIPQTILTSLSQIKRAGIEAEDSSTSNWEGLIIRADTFYKGCRSRDIQKLKTFDDSEFIVTRLEISDNCIYPPTITTPSKLMTAAVIKRGDVEVSVGSGFTIEERMRFAMAPDELINKIITVKYFGETGRGSLRFPTLKAIHGANRKF